MYLDFYNLHEEPFRITPDPDFFFLSRSHREAFASVVYGVNERKGFVMLTGEVGTGKTTVLRAYLKQAEGSGIRPIYLFDPDISFGALLRMMLRELGALHSSTTSTSLLEQLQTVLIGEFRENRNVVLLIDEAQNMSIDTLEKLRMLSNLETEKEKLLQIVLVGQPELERKLETHAVRQLKQRIAVRATIQPLSKKESAEYIRHRLKQAGARGRVFSAGALRALVRQAKGIPRSVNILCDNALIAGYGSQRRPVSTKIVANVIAELEGRRPKRYLRRASAAAMVALLVGFIVSLGVAAGWDVAIKADLLAAGARMLGATPVSASQAPGLQTTPPAPSLIVEAPAALPERPPVAREPREEQTPPLIAPLKLAGLDLIPDVREVTEPAVEVSAPLIDTDQPVEPDAVAEFEETEHFVEVAAPETDARPPVEVDAIVELEPMGQESAESEDPPSGHVVRVAQAGDCLTQLVEEVYGFCDARLLERVKMQNPAISDVNLIFAGSVIAFPVDEMTTADLDVPEHGTADNPAREISEL
jgi:general secretion pathway protein A